MSYETTATGQQLSTALTLDTLNLTITLWAKRDGDRNTNAVLASLDNDGSGIPYVLIGTDATGDLCYIEHNDETDDDVSGPTFTNTDWFFLCLSRAGAGTNSAKFYYSTGFGAISTSQVTFDDSFIANRFVIGDLQTTGEWWDGRISNVKLWSRGLSLGEVIMERASVVPRSTVGLVGHWLPPGSNDYKKDYSGNGHTLDGSGGISTYDPPLLYVPVPRRRRVGKAAAAGGGRIFKLGGTGGGLAGPSRGLVAAPTLDEVLRYGEAA